jgi:hypothetical protein
VGRVILSILLFVPFLTAGALAAGDDIERIKSYVHSSSDEAEKEAEVRQLLEGNPALANARDDDGSILQWALGSAGTDGDLGKKSQKLAELLIAKGADVNALDSDGVPLLIRFAVFAQTVPMEILLKGKAGVNAKEEETGRTALHHVALLVENPVDARPDPERLERTLHAARALVKAGAGVNTKDASGVTPLMATAFLGNLKMTELLIASGADVNTKDNEGYSVLGIVLARLEEDWASKDEKSYLPPVIAALKAKGARDERPAK